MKSFKEIQSYVVEQLDKLQVIIEPKGLYEPIDYELKVGGKRLRPTLALFACQCFAGSFEHAVKTALALEVFHNYTLMHDDVMDNADKRRNKPTVHKVWNLNTAILSGDAMMALSYKMLEDTPDSCFKKVFSVFSEGVLGVDAGQQYDMEFETRNDVKIDEYIDMVKLKTGVLIGTSLKVGAICGGASDADAQKLYDFGMAVGVSFQLCDDLLDVYGDTKTFGKNIGGDICCNKKTYLLLKAQQLAAGTPMADELNRWLQMENFNRDEKIKAVTDIYNKLGVDKHARSLMDKYYFDAIDALKSSSISNECKAELEKVAAELLKRNV